MRSDNSKIKEIFKDLSFSDNEIKIIESVFHKVIYKKGSIILKPDDIVENHYYILEGCLRSYYIDNQGKEHTVQFGVKDWWISDYTAFFSDTKSIMTIEVIQDAILYRLSKSDKEYLYSQIPRIESFFRKKLERAFAAFQKRILSNLSQTATQRYINFIKTYPNIEKNIKNYHIASYLGITTESLSRIRKDLTS
ncbi:Crp/Fnr family transcriptional regulator [Psychroserpens sp.]|uniref:Crp/Fnr family transcriptional regulator n=1 Tax=Psychroserpens sp. TaxID=2020870 RepID=UPI001B24C3C2|nr:Crp/Fnr family transcriptional regulator [Psychroserpens sp.]MBO6606870.1 Crp/Fnr family transcriptional regulator [Psychroserpens sp.]MBO6630595.1 Crp/Fnr family transcriptional regulator [Psychroserpens sp.]MBO6654016.1 Crp/Fnr family transcriptional regulator [Psychroserpens sp.]MBO6682698.1 Crp/Fnr family transcriptional regulator [Psychroserpens sp.]MBO6750642.1 Crp/Fnr family transcriptional regulator [Psychroserpens sp.]